MKIKEKPKLKNYLAEVLLYIGEYETYTHCRYYAPDYDSALKVITSDWGLDEEEPCERRGELVNLVEVTDSDDAVLRKYI